MAAASMDGDGDAREPLKPLPTNAQAQPSPCSAATTASSSSPVFHLSLPAATADDQSSSPPSTPGMLTKSDSASSNGTPHKSRSILNLTSSTLFGIYSPTGFDSTNRQGDELNTPWGTGAQTPLTRNSSTYEGTPFVPSSADFSAHEKNKRRRSTAAGGRPRTATRTYSRSGTPPSLLQYTRALVVRIVALFLMGIVYGVFITQLHDSRTIAPVKVEGINRRSWTYLLFWGILGVVLGCALPLVDGFLKRRQDEADDTAIESDEDDDLPVENLRDESPESSGAGRPSLGAEWNPIVRSVGALVAIAFAIVRYSSPSSSCVNISNVLPAEIAVAVNTAGITDAHSRQPRHMVSYRPFKAGFHPFDCCRADRFCNPP